MKFLLKFVVGIVILYFAFLASALAMMYANMTMLGTTGIL